MAISSTEVTRTITGTIPYPPVILNRMGDERTPTPETYTKAIYYTLNIEASGDSLTIDTQGAIGVTFNTDKALTLKVPQMDANGLFPETTAEVIYDLAEGSASGGMFTNPAAGRNGWISRDIMPPALRFFNTEAADATVQVFVTFPTR